jgi:opacity protein-like surface antigen
MFRRALVVSLIAICAAIVAQAASADPSNAKNSLLVNLTCAGKSVQASVNGNGEFTPGHVVGSTAMLIPTAFNLTFSFTPTGGSTQSETDTAAKHNAGNNSVTCQVPANQNTFTTPDGTLVLSGTVTGFFTPANG